MATKIIVSYDGTDNDRDALALGQLLASAGGSLSLAYVRHAYEAKSGRERFAEQEADALLQAGATAIGLPDIPRHVVLSGSTSEGLRELAIKEQADMIVFGSEYRTAHGHLDPQASARRLLDGGPVALALAPAGFVERSESGISHDRRDRRGRRSGRAGDRRRRSQRRYSASGRAARGQRRRSDRRRLEARHASRGASPSARRPST